MAGRHSRPVAAKAPVLSRRTLLTLGALVVPAGAGLAWWLAASGSTDFVLGVTRPDASNTGVAPGTRLTVVDGDLTMSTGQTYHDLDIHGFVHGAPAASLINSRVRGRGTGYLAPGLVNGGAGTSGMRISRCTLKPDVPRFFLNGFDGSHCVIDRCDISEVCDGIHSTSDDTVVLGSYLHDFSFFDGSTGSDHADDPFHPGWAHVDGLQALGGRSLRFVGNTVRMYISRAVGTPQTALAGGYPDGNYGNGVTISPRLGRVSGFDISRNWFSGGDVVLQVVAANAGFDNSNDGTIAGNRCGTDQKPLASGRTVQMRAAAGLGTFTGLSTNVFDDSPAVPVDLRGQPLKSQSADSTTSFSFSLSG